MESLFNELRINLENQQDNLKQLVNIAREHNRALRQLDAGKLNDIIASEEEIVKNIVLFEEERKKITDSLSGELGIEANAGLGEFSEKAPVGMKENLNKLLDNMSQMALELKEINGQNDTLTRQAIRFNEMFIRVLAPSERKGYTQKGQIEDTKVSLLDKKV
ncbi:MAG: flagellar protein FlgN [Bacillota bacterium]